MVCPVATTLALLIFAESMTRPTRQAVFAAVACIAEPVLPDIPSVAANVMTTKVAERIAAKSVSDRASLQGTTLRPKEQVMSQTIIRNNWLMTEISSGLGRSPAEAALAVVVADYKSLPSCRRASSARECRSWDEMCPTRL
jgi:hypothetical protein